MIAAGDVQRPRWRPGLHQGFGIGFRLAVELGAFQAADGGEHRSGCGGQVPDRTFVQDIVGGELNGGLEP